MHLRDHATSRLAEARDRWGLAATEAPRKSRAEGTTNLDHSALCGRESSFHQADRIEARRGRYETCLPYLSYFSYSLSLGNSTRCDHRTDFLSTKPFFPISHFVYTLLYVDAPIPLSRYYFPFL